MDLRSVNDRFIGAEVFSSRTAFCCLSLVNVLEMVYIFGGKNEVQNFCFDIVSNMFLGFKSV